jgi:hypothetical protein
MAAAIADKTAGKLAPLFYGPFRVEERVGAVAYRLVLPPRARIHSVFHVVFLKKFISRWKSCSCLQSRMARCCLYLPRC